MKFEEQKMPTQEKPAEKHPEQKEDEIFLGNFEDLSDENREEQEEDERQLFEDISYKTKRRGEMKDGLYPVFVKESEFKGEPEMEEVLIDGEKTKCKKIDMLTEYAEAFKTADSYRKIGKVEARQATEREEIATTQDGTKNIAEPGDWIIKNPGDKDPYVFGDKSDSIDVRQQKFAKKYEIIDDEPGVFRPKGIIKAVKVNENLVFDTSWGEKMAVKGGGWVADGGYAIAKESFDNTYERIPSESEKAEEQKIKDIREKLSAI
ncbi:MAG: hypothetical protein WCI36_00635 [bacterium]